MGSESNMRVRKVKLKLFGHSGIKSGARIVQGGKAFENRELYIEQSKNTKNGIVPQIETKSRVKHEE